MRTALATVESHIETAPEPRQTTLLELVRAVSEVTDDDHEVVATVLHMLKTGTVRLCGTFADEPIDAF